MGNMSVSKQVEEIDSPFLWRSAIITAIWLGIFTVMAVILFLFKEPIRNLFFG